MASLNLSDPAAITAVYSSILVQQNNWLLLHYVSDSHDELGLHSYGNEGLEELKNKIADLDKIFIAFYREESDSPGYILINYIPPSTSGGRRARTLVHSRRVGAILKKHQTIFTVDSLSLLTTDNIHEAIIHPETAFTPSSPSPQTATHQIPTKSKPEENSLTEEPEHIDPPRGLPSIPDPVGNPFRPLQPVRSTSRPGTPNQPTQNSILRPVRAPSQPPSSEPSTQTVSMFGRPFTSASRDGLPPAVPLLPKGFFNASTTKLDNGGGGGGTPPAVPLMPKGFLSKFLKGRKKSNSVDELPDDPPPPTPPKDQRSFNVKPIAFSRSQPAPQYPRSPQEHERAVRHQRSHSMSEFAMINHPSETEDMVVVEPPEQVKPAYTLPLSGKWAGDPTTPGDPEERARRRRELQLKREQEERETLEAERRRQSKLKKEKEDMLKQEAEAERRRKIEVEEEIRRIKEERKRKEEMERAEEERKHEELEERRRQNRDRKMEEHRKLEQWRLEQARKAEAAARQAEEARRQEDIERKSRIQQAATRLRGTKDESDVTGWVTMLGKDSLSWKRRFYKFTGTIISLYRDSKDLTSPLDTVDLRGNLKALKEWNEGYEDLEAIAFSFVVEFKRGRDYWSMYADSDAEKYKILGLLKVAGGL